MLHYIMLANQWLKIYLWGGQTHIQNLTRKVIDKWLVAMLFV